MADGSIHKAIPRQVLEEIKSHVRQNSYRSERAWKSASNSEDTITGHWGGKIEMGWSEQINAEGYHWRYRIDYRKFSSSTEEPEMGADGIFQVEVERFDIAVSPVDPSTVRPEAIETVNSFKKGLLFQAKKADNTKRKEMMEQLKTIEHLTPGNGEYFEYGPSSFRVASAKSVIESDGYTKRMADSEFSRLGDFLADSFLECKRGVEGLYCDFEEDALYFPKGNDEIARVQREMKHGIRVRVNAFRVVEFDARSEPVARFDEGF